MQSTKERRIQAIHLAQGGTTTAEIARRLGVNYKTAYRYTHGRPDNDKRAQRTQSTDTPPQYSEFLRKVESKRTAPLTNQEAVYRFINQNPDVREVLLRRVVREHFASHVEGASA